MTVKFRGYSPYLHPQNKKWKKEKKGREEGKRPRTNNSLKQSQKISVTNPR